LWVERERIRVFLWVVFYGTAEACGGTNHQHILFPLRMELAVGIDVLYVPDDDSAGGDEVGFPIDFEDVVDGLLMVETMRDSHAPPQDLLCWWQISGRTGRCNVLCALTAIHGFHLRH
jgi:hypothetical protein